jgi:hypothetical protein
MFNFSEEKPQVRLIVVSFLKTPLTGRKSHGSTDRIHFPFFGMIQFSASSREVMITRDG